MAIEFESAPDAARGGDGDLRAELLAIADWAGDNVALAVAPLVAVVLMLLGAYSVAKGRKRDAHGYGGDWGGDGGCGD